MVCLLSKTKQVLKQDPSIKVLPLVWASQKQSDTITFAQLLGSQASTGDRIATLENRIQSLESFNQSLQPGYP